MRGRFYRRKLGSFQKCISVLKTPSPPSDKIIAADLPLTIHQLTNPTSSLRDQTHSYIAGFIIKKLNKDFFLNCKQCLSQICTNRPSEEYQVHQKSLKYSSITFKRTIEYILNYIGENISKICHHENIYLKFTNKISSLYNFNNILHCQDHEQCFQTKMIGMVVKMMISILRYYYTTILRKSTESFMAKKKYQNL